MIAAGSPPFAPNRTVLVIDDEDYVADMIAAALQAEGLHVHIAYNGRDGLAQAQQLQLDLLIVDIMMPYLNGLALIAQLRQLAPLASVPIILISAGVRPQSLPSNIAFMAKPFNISQLLRLAANYLPPQEKHHDGA